MTWSAASPPQPDSGCLIRIFPVQPVQQFGRTLLILGAVLIAVGALLYFGGKLPFRLGRLPGDIVHRGQNRTFYFPLVSCLVISVFISLILWIINQFRR
jgi:hypothetical protein